ncbi:MAG: MBL fold metallo-hydrolase [Thermoplasmata archaeon]
MPFRTEHYNIEQVAEGIYAAIARPEGYALSNSGMVDLGDAPLIFDTSMCPRAADDLGRATARILGAPPSLAANSHWHLDHSLGNHQFQGIPIFGTRRTREILLERHDELMAELARDEIMKSLHEFEEKREAARSEAARADLDFLVQLHRALLADAGNLSVTPPDHTFENKLSLPGSRDAVLLSFGAGHTEADALLFLPRERVLFAGDLVVATNQPSLGSGDPGHWLAVLDQIEHLGAERVVPGHGPVIPTEGIRETRDYISGILEAAQTAPGSPLPPAIRRWEGSLTLDQNLRFARGLAPPSAERK